MLRYYAYASAIVAIALAALLAVPRFGTAPPRERPDGRPRANSAPSGPAPWALSAVPECYRQIASFGGAPAFARPHVPSDARRIAAGTRLRVADCDLRIAAASATLARGDSRFVVPATAFFSAGSRLVLDQRSRGREEVRIYVLTARPR